MIKLSHSHTDVLNIYYHGKKMKRLCIAAENLSDFFTYNRTAQYTGSSYNSKTQT